MRRLDDASGVDGEWYMRDRALGGWVEALLKIAGELYLPFLVANADAFARGLERLEIEVWGLPYALAPFKYQVKCLQQLRSKFAALGAGGSCGVTADPYAHRLLANAEERRALSSCPRLGRQKKRGEPSRRE